MIKSLVCLVAGVAGAGAVPATAAVVEPETVVGIVDVSDVDLADVGGIARFERRLNHQARSLCDTGRTLDLHQRRAEARCIASVKESGRQQLSQLVAAARKQSGQRLASKDF